MEQAYQIDEMKEEQNQNPKDTKKGKISPIIVIILGSILIISTVVVFKRKKK